MNRSGFLLRAGGFRASMGLLKEAVPSNGETNMRVACAHLSGEIKDRAPVDLGHLKASYAHVVETDGDAVIGHVGTNVHYAAPQEFYGTPHIRPALDANEQRLIKIMAEDTLTDAIGHL